ncbi:serine/threonine-protein phosphatase 7 long form-like protein [Senna tora]|uniref:Serine/threonine-protein phosphatase 7 long form-like protein n=1 Tax=Senna tora TaxID=362788 RepID=A0A834TR79_9FABA|nr:serine/threonine-protein phosphatase 7 long form-like protein [Senna tora]
MDFQRRTARHIRPGLEDPSLLYLQDRHISEAIVCSRALELLNLPAQIVPFLQQTGFMALPVGECSITLQDVATQLGLPIDGRLVTGRTNYTWAELCVRFLGEALPADQFKGSRVMMSWFDETFSQVPENSTDVQMEQFTQGYIMRLLGGFLMSDTSGNLQTLMYLPLLENMDEVKNYSWGSAVLALPVIVSCNRVQRGEHQGIYASLARVGMGQIPLASTKTKASSPLSPEQGG